MDRQAASRAAVAARRARAAVKSDVASGRRSALDVLQTAFADPEGVEGRMRVTDLLISVPAIGATKLERILSDLRISRAKRIGGLGVHQRERLSAFLTQRESTNRARRRSRLVVLAGPTAVGKGTVASYIRDNYPDVLLSVSATTRAPRQGEVDGVHYFFVDDAEFDRMIAEGELLEYATVHNSYRYGTPRSPIEKALAEGSSVLLEIDLQGARQVRARMPEATLVFLLPPTWDELVRRLVGRGTEDAVERARRLDTAQVELAAQDEFDYRVTNTTVGEAAQEVVELIKTRGRGPRRAQPEAAFTAAETTRGV
ncbi:guanylate kinase [Paramicrobacterium agarici]|uniref:Guanylate kinase n=1 Tax=Paramicrobacterium agarici TaxID=630514 RepID=A0A2A9DYC2_9MICO|nr:guanylate kinase [Microbacterium agarici]TQO21207.1 guanylate kinase [Microbacterium agarici]TQO24423.1 guanylate kinase [Microbacterium agarici]